MPNFLSIALAASFVLGSAAVIAPANAQSPNSASNMWHNKLEAKEQADAQLHAKESRQNTEHAWQSKLEAKENAEARLHDKEQADAQLHAKENAEARLHARESENSVRHP